MAKQNTRRMKMKTHQAVRAHRKVSAPRRRLASKVRRYLSDIEHAKQKGTTPRRTPPVGYEVG